MKNVFLIGLAGLILTACNVPNVIPETQTSSARLGAQAVGVVYRVNTNLSVNAFHSIAEVYDFAATTGFNAGDSILFASQQTFNLGAVVTCTDPSKSHFKLLQFSKVYNIKQANGICITTTLAAGKNQGTPASPIKLGTYDPAQPTKTTFTPIERANIFINQAGAQGIYLENVAGYDIGNLNIIGPGYDSSTADGIIAYNKLSGDTKLDFLNFHDLEVSFFGVAGISVGGGNGQSGFKNVFITNSVVHDNLKVGIQTFGTPITPTTVGYANSDVYVGNCKAYNHRGKPGLKINTGSGILIGSTQRATVERSVAYSNGERNEAEGGPIGMWTYDSDQVKIQYNESHHNRTNSPADGGGFDIDGGVTNSVMQYNYSHDNDGAGYLIAQYEGTRALHDNKVRYNISQNDGRKNGYGAIHFYGQMDQIDIYNNTVFVDNATKPASAILMTKPGTYGGAPTSPGCSLNPLPVTPTYTIGPVSNARVKNNIFYARNNARLLSIGGGNPNLSFDSNRYFHDNTGTNTFPYFYGFGGDFGTGGNNYQGTSAANTLFTNLAAFKLAKPAQEVVGTQGNPLLTAPGTGGTFDNAYLLNTLGAYKLQATSPIKDWGLAITNPGSNDFYGTALPTNVDLISIGAHQP